MSPTQAASQHWCITPRDPLVARDGRPFFAGGGSRMKSLDWLMPSVVAGAFRSLYGLQRGVDFATEAGELLKIRCDGALPVVDNEMYFPAPANCAARRDAQGILRYSRLKPDAQGQIVVDILAPAQPVPVWWSRANLERWLTRQEITLPNPQRQRVPGYVPLIAHDARNHVRINDALRKGEDEMLFETVGLDLSLPGSHAVVQLAARTVAPDAVSPSLHTLGGERRMVYWGNGESSLWTCPEAVQRALTETTQVCLVLATPGWFKDGSFPVAVGATWKPPGVHDVELTFKGACLHRWQAVSGWAMREVNGAPRGPKALRRLAPAGSVYFFTCNKGDGAQLASHWLESVSDDTDGGQLRRDGFGLALWGVW